MEKWIVSIILIFLLVLSFVAGRYSGSKQSTITSNVSIDTIYVQRVDTIFTEKLLSVVRTDTVRLYSVDTLFTHDSILVEIPIEEKTFTGENYSILTEGFRVKLKEVNISYPTVTTVVTDTKLKRWSFGVGAQLGYGYTMHGLSPYLGLGVSFGYNF